MQKERQEKKEKEDEEKREKERQEAEEAVRRMHEGTDSLEERLAVVSGQDGEKPEDPKNPDQKLPSAKSESPSKSSDLEASSKPPKTVSSTDDAEESEAVVEDGVSIGKDGKKHTIVTRSKTGSLQPRTFNMDDLKRRSTTSNMSKDDLEKLEKLDRSLKDEGDGTRLTRQKAHQIASGTHLFKLGMDNNFKSYVNQYSTNQIALNKPQRNEERDKKRHLSHKFSLTQASEFKWIGSLTGTRALLVSTIRQTILQLESNIQAPYMHTNWPLLRKPWTTAVGACVNPRDFARALIVLQACIKSVVFASVWHDQLGHVKLQRVTALEREEKKRLDKKEKKEKEDEEERNRLTYNFVKYSLGLKHQVWKQKGEEYRVHGQWGWLWISSSRRYKFHDTRKSGLRGGPQKIMVQIRDRGGIKILALDPPTYDFLVDEYCPKKPKIELDNQQDVKSLKIKEEVEPEDSKEDDPSKKNLVVGSVKSEVKTEIKEESPESRANISFLAGMKIEKVFEPISSFEEIDVTKALTTPGRLHYPKIAKKTRIDEFLARRTHLKLLEERRMLQSERTKELAAAAAAASKPATPGEDHPEGSHEDEESTDTSLQSILSGKPPNKALSATARDMLNQITKRIQQVRSQYASIMRLGRSGACYSRYCNMTGQSGKTPVTPQSLNSTCYSPSCLQKARLKRELLTLLRKANVLNNNQNPPSLAPLGGGPMSQLPLGGMKKEHGDETNDAIRRDLESAVALATHCAEEVAATNVDVRTNLKKSSPDEAASPMAKRRKLESAEDAEVDVQVDVGKVETVTTATSPVTPARPAAKTPDSTSTTQEVVTSAASTTTIVNRRGRTVHRVTNPKELNSDGSVRVYSTLSTEGKVYLKKVAISLADRRKKRTPVKYPLCSTFATKTKHRSILLLPQHELRKLCRVGGRTPVQGFHHIAKANMSVWPYPCPRPLFKTCWLYRTVGLRSLAAAALQLRILWACLRWDDMAAKPASTDGKHQITTDTEIMSLEILKHRQVGQFMDRTQYLRRKVVIPLELPKQVRGSCLEKNYFSIIIINYYQIFIL